MLNTTRHENLIVSLQDPQHGGRLLSNKKIGSACEFKMPNDTLTAHTPLIKGVEVHAVIKGVDCTKPEALSLH